MYVYIYLTLLNRKTCSTCASDCPILWVTTSKEYNGCGMWHAWGKLGHIHGFEINRRHHN